MKKLLIIVEETMLKVFVPIFLLALLVVLPGNSRAMVGDDDWAKDRKSVV